MTKVVFAGDTHGDFNQLAYLINICKKEGAKLIVQLGDFGFIWNDPVALTRLTRMLGQAEIELWWLDGNHENFHLMQSNGCNPNNNDATWVSEKIWYLPRGFRFVLDGVKFMAFGGAVSVDRNRRRPGSSWWNEETIKTQQVDAVTAEPVDVFLSHDGPSDVAVLDEMLAKTARYWPEDALRDSAWNRKLLAEVVDRVQPRLLVHGHYHVRYSGVRGDMQVEGLANDGTGVQSYMMFDTETFNV